MTLQGDLRPYQKLGMSWLLFLREHGFGACLADDMGLGKTVQMIAYLLHVKDKEGAGKELPTASKDEQKSEPIIVDEESNTESSDEARSHYLRPRILSQFNRRLSSARHPSLATGKRNWKNSHPHLRFIFITDLIELKVKHLLK